MLPSGVFTLSLDFELVWGSRDLAPDPTELVRQSIVTRQAVFGPLLDSLLSTGIRATWATVGHLFLDRAEPGNGPLHSDLEPPHHAWHPRPWFEGVPAGTESSEPAWYGRSLVQRLVAAGQEVGSHSFSHPIFGDEGCSRQAADQDLARCVAEARKLGIALRSFVFPRNQPGHVDLLARHGFRCWRPPEPSSLARLPKSVGRLGHLAQVALARTPPTVLPTRDAHGLWCVPGSAVFLPTHGVRRLIPMRQRVARCIRGIDAAAAQRRIFHLYTHPINLADRPEACLSAFQEIFEHAARLRDAGRLDILSMDEVADRAEAAAG